MAENKNKVRHVLHRRSNVSSPKTINIERTTLVVNNPKAPQFTDIEFGEIAVNYGDGNEALFIRNSENEIVQLNSIKNIRYDGEIDASLNQYLDERYVNRSGDVIYGDITIEAQEGYNDDPKFKYNGSKFEVISENLIMDIKETTIDSENMVLSVKGSSNDNKCDGSFEINADNVGVSVSCNKGEIINGNSELTVNGKYTETVDGETSLYYNDNYSHSVVDGDVKKEILINDSGITETINGNSEISVNGNINETVVGNIEKTVNGNINETTIGFIEHKHEGNYTLSIDKGEGCASSLNVNVPNIEMNLSCNHKEIIQGNCETTINGTETLIISGTSNHTIGAHNYNVTKLEAKVDETNWNGDSFNMTQELNLKVETPLFELEGTTTKMVGTELNVEYSNIDLNGTADIDITTPILEINGTTSIDVETPQYNLNGTETSIGGDNLTVNYGNIEIDATTSMVVETPQYNLNGTTSIDVDTPKYNLNGTETSMGGDNLTVNYGNIDLNGTTDIDVISPNVNINASTELQLESALIEINGTETSIGGDNLTVNYGNIEINGTTSIDVETPQYNLNGATTNLQGTELNVEYSNIDLNGTADIDITSPNVNINGTTSMVVETPLFELEGTTTRMVGTELNVEYSNINQKATNAIENYDSLSTISTTNNTEGDTWNINYNDLTINGNTTMNGDSLNENYTTINRVTTTINNTATTENNHVDTTNFYGNVNVDENLVIKGNVNISGNTTIDGDLVLNPNKSFDGKLKNYLNFKVATSATKTASSTITASIELLKYNNSNAEGYTTEIGSDVNPLVTKTYVDDVFENILNDNNITTTIDSFKELQDVLGVTNNGEITNTTYNTVVNGINAKVNRSGDTMTGTLKVGTDGVTITTSGTINTRSNVTSNGAISATNNITTESKFVGNLNNTISFEGGTFANASFNNANGVTVNVPTDISHLSCNAAPSSWTVFDNRYVNVAGDTMTGALTVNGGNITTDSKFVGSLNNTISFEGGTFADASFNNANGTTVKVPTDISHLSCNAAPSSWTVFDNRYVNVAGDTMTGKLTINSGGLSVVGDATIDGTITATGAMYSSDKKLKKNIKSVSNKDIEAVSKVDLKSYKFINDESERERYGVIAQDLEKVGLDNLVVETDNKKGVDYISFLILKIAQLEKRIEELEKR